MNLFVLSGRIVFVTSLLALRLFGVSVSERYKEAMAVATTDLVVTHPIRLGLALNFSVFHYEVLGNPEEACKMARQAFEDAIAELDSVSEDSYKVRHQLFCFHYYSFICFSSSCGS